MSDERATVLVIDDDADVLHVLERQLQAAGTFRVEGAADGLSGWTRAQQIRPDLILSDLRMPGIDGFELCRRVKGDPALAGVLFVILSGTSDSAVKTEGLTLGVDDFLTKPVEGAELRAKLHAMLRLKRLHDELHQDRTELREMHRQLAQSFDQAVALLVRLLDLGLPGAAARSDRLAVAATQLADRFEIPLLLRRDLDLAARLHEIGRVVSHDREGEAFGPLSGDWEYVLRSRDVLGQVEQLRPAGDVIAAIYENWDGTGVPDHRRQGEIPLRSRILRVLIDFYAILERSGTAQRAQEEALESLGARAGTWYDTVVLGHLREFVQEHLGGAAGLRRRVGVEELTDGMLLASDLYTSSGVKLLAAGALVTPAAREVIRRRHQSDPILGGIWIGQSRS